MTKYYFAGEARVAMRAQDQLKFIFGDQLGSTTVVYDVTTLQVTGSSTRPGARCGEAAPSQLKYTYTGQYSYMGDFGLMFYKARWSTILARPFCSSRYNYTRPK